MRNVLLPLVVCVGVLQAQSFDTASIKANRGSGNSISMGTSHGRLTVVNVSLRRLIEKGFGLQDYQVSGGPAWIDSDRFDVSARSSDTSIPDEKLWLLLQPVLVERFHLKFHRSTKEMPVYALVVAKGKPKAALAPHRGDEQASSRMTIGSGKATLDGTNMPMKQIAEKLSQSTTRIVIDRTRLAGGFDFRLEWAQDHSGESILNSIEESLGLSGPSMFTALQEQLGLKLESSRGPVDTLMVDGAEHPSVN